MSRFVQTVKHGDDILLIAGRGGLYTYIGDHLEGIFRRTGLSEGGLIAFPLTAIRSIGISRALEGVGGNLLRFLEGYG